MRLEAYDPDQCFYSPAGQLKAPFIISLYFICLPKLGIGRWIRSRERKQTANSINTIFVWIGMWHQIVVLLSLSSTIEALATFKDPYIDHHPPKPSSFQTSVVFFRILLEMPNVFDKILARKMIRVLDM